MKLHEFKALGIEQINDTRDDLYYEAMSLGTFEKAVKFVKDQKDETHSFSATAEEALVYNVANQICDEVLHKLYQQALKQPTNWKEQDDHD